MSQEVPQKAYPKVGWYSYVALALAALMFSGLFTNIDSQSAWAPLRALDFTVLNGVFGTLGGTFPSNAVINLKDVEGTINMEFPEGSLGGTLEDSVEVSLGGSVEGVGISGTIQAGIERPPRITVGNFTGAGGNGARGGFLFALSLIPAVVLALGIVRVVDGYGGLLACEKLITPLFKPMLGIPGICGLAFITHLQSTDGAAGMTKELFDSGFITDKERSIFCQLQFSGNGTVTNYFSSVGGGLMAYFAATNVPIIVPFIVIIICKIIGANLMRLVLIREKS